jgi:hypothetical protein
VRKVKPARHFPFVAQATLSQRLLIEIIEARAELVDRHGKRIESAIGDPPNPTTTSETA